MTALAEYERLESTGLWRGSPEARPRDVIVSFGNATLVLSDHDETAVAHWSLAAVTRINPRRRPAFYSPSPDGFETLEIEDDLMIRAIERVIGAVARHGPHPGRLRVTGFLSILVLIAAMAAFWLPGALIRHTASVVPEAARNQIGGRLLVQIERLSGEPCRSAPGMQALNRLRQRVAPKARRLTVLRTGVTETLHLPGGIILLGRGLVEDRETPEALAAYVAAEVLRSESRDPLERLLRTAGPIATFRLLVSGQVADETLDAHATYLLTEPPDPVDRERVDARFADLGIAAAPYLDSLNAQGEDAVLLTGTDQPDDTPRELVLSDSDWIGLRNICIS